MSPRVHSSWYIAKIAPVWIRRKFLESEVLCCHLFVIIILETSGLDLPTMTPPLFRASDLCCRCLIHQESQRCNVLKFHYLVHISNCVLDFVPAFETEVCQAAAK